VSNERARRREATPQKKNDVRVTNVETWECDKWEET